MSLYFTAARDEKGKCESRKRYGEGSAHEQEVVRRIKLMRRKRKGGLKGKYENSFGIENLTIVKKRFDLDTSPSPFAKLLCEGI